MTFETNKTGNPIISATRVIQELGVPSKIGCGEPARMQACFIVQINPESRAVKKKSRFNLTIKQPTFGAERPKVDSRAVAVVTARQSKIPPCYLSSFI